MKFHKGSPKAARAYLERDHSRADDYYLKEGAGLAERFVATPNTMTAKASMDGDTYETWVHGYDVDTGLPKGRIREDPQANRYAEVTVNGPKTWSLAAALHPEISDALDTAQDQAAQEIIRYLAQHSTTRVGGRGKQVQVPVEEIEAAVIRHYTSRAGDPHRHLHLQINVRVKAAGAWRGIHTVGVRDQIEAINGIGHAAVLANPVFRQALAAHGFTLDFESGEIVQLKPYVSEFSARTRQIQSNIDRYETTWRKEHPGEEPGPKLRQIWDRRAWADARPDKITPTSGRELVERWNTELAATGYVNPTGPADVKGCLPGAVPRDQAADIVVSRLGVRKSAWNAADIRGTVELLLAETGIYADTAARTELAEDITARALASSVPLLTRTDVPEHVRAMTSETVLDVEAEIIIRLVDRAEHPLRINTAPPADDSRRGGMRVAPRPAKDDSVHSRAVAALALSDSQLVVIEGAAGSGKTSLLRTAQLVLNRRDHRMLVVTPTRKAAEVAARETGAAGYSAAWLTYQHGFRRRPDGTNAHPERVEPKPEAVLRPGDLLVVDEAGMLDQDTARQLLEIVDRAGARIAFIGDRQQLPAVGRGGVMDHAVTWSHPSTRFDLEEVHRFRDPAYVDIAAKIRYGQQPEVVFDQLVARGQVVIHSTELERTAALADLAVSGQMVIADTREQVTQLNATAQQANDIGQAYAVATESGERIGLGDRVATRRNDEYLQVTNRQTWTVTGTTADGGLIINRPGTMSPGTPRHGTLRPDVELPPEYVQQHVELAYATTVYGAQGETTTVAHLAVGDSTSRASAYVAMSRGRSNNVAHLVADNVDAAKVQWVEIFDRDRADLGPAAARIAAAEAVEQYGPAATTRARRPIPTPPPAPPPPSRSYGPGLGI